MKVSRTFLIRLKLSDNPAYRTAQQANVNTNWLSRAINGIEPVKPGDKRIIAVGRILGLAPEECFHDEPADTEMLQEGVDEK